MNIRTLCLGILTHGEASGYEIKKMIEEGRFSHFIDASFGSIYPALTQLTAEGLLTVRAQEQTGKPDKKVYSITETGRASLARSITVSPAKDKFKSEFLFQMLLMEFLSQAQRAIAYDKQLRDLREDIGRIEQCDLAEATAGARFVQSYGRTVVSTMIAFLERHRDEVVRRPDLKAAE